MRSQARSGTVMSRPGTMQTQNTRSQYSRSATEQQRIHVDGAYEVEDPFKGSDAQLVSEEISSTNDLTDTRRSGKNGGQDHIRSDSPASEILRESSSLASPRSRSVENQSRGKQNQSVLSQSPDAGLRPTFRLGRLLSGSIVENSEDNDKLPSVQQATVVSRSQIQSGVSASGRGPRSENAHNPSVYRGNSVHHGVTVSRQPTECKKDDNMRLTQHEINKITDRNTVVTNEEYVVLLMKLKSGQIDDGQADELIKALNNKIN